MVVRGEFDTPVALPPYPNVGLVASLETFAKGSNFSSYRVSNYDCSVVQPVPQLLYRLS
jgi:hypothetical protein